MIKPVCNKVIRDDPQGRSCMRPVGHGGVCHIRPFEHDKDTRRIRFNSLAIEDIAMSFVITQAHEIKLIKTADRGLKVYAWFKGNKWYSSGGKEWDMKSCDTQYKWSEVADEMAKHHLYPF